VSDYTISIPGIWSYLIKWVRNNLNLSGRLVTYSDNRLSKGTVYQRMGFKLAETVPPDYYWVRNSIRYHRSSLRKTTAEKLTKLTEKQLRMAAGFTQVFDLGKLKWELQL